MFILILYRPYIIQKLILNSSYMLQHYKLYCDIELFNVYNILGWYSIT